MRFRLSAIRGFGHASGDWGGKDPIGTKPRSSPGSGAAITRRELGTLAAGTVALSAQLTAQTARADPSHSGPILDIAEWSYRWYGVEAKLANAIREGRTAKHHRRHWRALVR